jgi:hypothetical protein
MERRRRFTLVGIESDTDTARPYPARVVCSIDQGGRLIVWGHPELMQNVQTIRRATFPCTVLCLSTPPPQQLSHVPESVAWVHPNHSLIIV